MEIRIMKPADYSEVMNLWRGAAGVGISPDDSEEYIAGYLERNPNTSFVAVEDNKIIGAIMAGHDGYRGAIRHTAVSEEYRGRGIGRKLVENAVQALKSEDVNKINLVVFESNVSGNAFWEKMGFTVRTDLTYRNLRLN